MPPAARTRTPGWRDPRLWVGLAIVAASVVAGARLLAAADDTVTVWAVAADMGQGDLVTDEDLVATRVRFADEGELDRYLGTDEVLDGDLQLTRGVGAGELLPRTALGPAADSGTVQVPLAVEAEQVPPSVAAGSVVDVHVLPAAGARPPLDAGPGPALAAVTVVEAPDPAAGLGSSGRRQLVVAVPEDDAADFFELVGAAEGAALTVVRRS